MPSKAKEVCRRRRRQKAPVDANGSLTLLCIARNHKSKKVDADIAALSAAAPRLPWAADDGAPPASAAPPPPPAATAAAAAGSAPPAAAESGGKKKKAAAAGGGFGARGKKAGR